MREKQIPKNVKENHASYRMAFDREVFGYLKMMNISNASIEAVQSVVE